MRHTITSADPYRDLQVSTATWRVARASESRARRLSLNATAPAGAAHKHRRPHRIHDTRSSQLCKQTRLASKTCSQRHTLAPLAMCPSNETIKTSL